MRGNDRMVSLPNIVAKIAHMESILQIKFFFEVKGQRLRVKGRLASDKTFILSPFTFNLINWRTNH